VQTECGVSAEATIEIVARVPDPRPMCRSGRTMAKCDEMVQGFIFYRLHEPFDPGIQIGRSDRQPLRLDALVFQKLLELS